MATSLPLLRRWWGTTFQQSLAASAFFLSALQPIAAGAISVHPASPSSRWSSMSRGGIISRMDLPRDAAIEFFTDIEGNWEYFSSLVDRSSVVHLDSGSNNLSLAPNSILVHGGDAPDKFPGDIRVVKALVRLKREHPDRVFLLCGNRDLNKLRLASELAEGETGEGTDIYWDKSTVPYQEYIEQKGLASGSVSTLKWMLECTMGCPTTFETRRMELESLQGETDALCITDEDVLQSFRDSVDPSGDDPWMLDYLRCAQLMLIVGDCLFVHGAISEKCLGKVPGRETVATGSSGMV